MASSEWDITQEALDIAGGEEEGDWELYADDARITG